MKRVIEKAGDRLRELARNLCGRIAPEKRIAVIVAMFCLFAIGNIWVVARAIWSIGRDNARQESIEIPQMQTPVFIPQETEEQSEQQSKIEDNDTATQQ